MAGLAAGDVEKRFLAADVNQQLSARLLRWATHPERAGGSLLLLSFAYGVLHALAGHGQSGDRDMAGDASFEAGNRHIVLTLAAALLQGFGYRVGGGRADRIATSGRAAPSERFLAGKGELRVSWRAGHLAVLAGHKRLRALLRKPASLSLYAAPCSP